MEPKQDVPGYERLRAALEGAYDQAARTKGKERHGQCKPYHEQPMQGISELIQSPLGMAYQVCKKIQEAATALPPDKAIEELKGAINYCAGMIIWLEDHPPQQLTAPIKLEGTVDATKLVNDALEPRGILLKLDADKVRHPPDVIHVELGLRRYTFKPAQVDVFDDEPVELPRCHQPVCLLLDDAPRSCMRELNHTGRCHPDGLDT